MLEYPCHSLAYDLNAVIKTVNTSFFAQSHHVLSCIGLVEWAPFTHEKTAYVHELKC